MAGKPRLDIDERRLNVGLIAAEKRLNDRVERRLRNQEGPLRERIVALAPVRTGKLRSGIVVEVVQRATGPVLSAGARGVPYALAVEFGTTDTPAQPFLRPALAEMPGKIKRGR